jgi:uncharacterized membrane protein YfcA
VSAGEVAELVGVGVAAGVLAGLFGVGGGVLFVPGLVLLADLSQLDAIGTSLAAMIPVILVGTWRHAHYGNVRWRPAGIVGVTSAVGVGVGTVIATSLPEDVLRTLFAVLLLATAARLAWSQLRPRQNVRAPRPPSA